MRQAATSLAQVEAREVALTAQLAGPAARARTAHERLARLQRDLATRRAALAGAAEEASQLAQVPSS